MQTANQLKLAMSSQAITWCRHRALHVCQADLPSGLGRRTCQARKSDTAVEGWAVLLGSERKQLLPARIARPEKGSTSLARR